MTTRHAIDAEFHMTTPITDRQAATRKLAQAHFLVEEGLINVFRLVSQTETDAEPIKLLEVNRDTVPTGVMPLAFDAAPERGVPYPSVIVEVTPDEYEQIRSATLRLPNGWRIAEEIPNANGGVPVE
jgi:hypothetical protein